MEAEILVEMESHFWNATDYVLKSGVCLLLEQCFKVLENVLESIQLIQNMPATCILYLHENCPYKGIFCRRF